ncbi:hypothetical protein PoB_001795600, partial [Plakobranchus ocellatus]
MRVNRSFTRLSPKMNHVHTPIIKLKHYETDEDLEFSFSAGKKLRTFLSTACVDLFIFGS